MAEKNENKPIVPLNHLVVINDGDRRWAKEHNVPAWEGHRRGSENVKGILEACQENNIHYVTMWGFSTENWKRSPEEVGHLMDLFRELLKNKHDEFVKNKICFRHLGRKDRLAPDLIELITKLENDTAEFTDWHFQVALDYGGRDEIIRATKKIVADVQAGSIDIQMLDDETFEKYLDTAGIPDPDLIVRTSGEQRVSGFLPFQATYAEYLFVPYYYPDMTKDKVLEIIEEYNKRQRRFGGS